MTLPDGQRRWAIRNARVPVGALEGVQALAGADDLCSVDLIVGEDRLEAVGSAIEIPADLPFLDAAQGVLLPSPVDAHTHLDKGHTATRAENTDGTWSGALAQTAADRTAHWSAADVRARMEFSLRCAYAHGTAAIRTHIDSVGPQTRISWPVFAEMRDRWRDRIDLQASPLFGIDFALDDAHMRDVTDMVGEFGSTLGAVTYPGASLRPGLQRLFRLASQKGYDLDFHTDEIGGADANSLAVIAETALEYKFEGRILAGHCCSLAVMPESDRDRTIDLVGRAGIAVVSLPMCNMYLQARGEGTPRWRGTTAYKELEAAGVDVMIASDNTRDPFYAYGDLDMLEVWREGTRILHLDHPFGLWARGIAATPARALGYQHRGRVGPGLPADMVLLKARRMTEVLARPAGDRIVIRHGRPIDAQPPAYAELDHLKGLKP